MIDSSSLAGRIVVVLLLAALTLSVPSPARAATCGSACSLFDDTQTVLQPSTSGLPGALNSHAETTTVVWQGQRYLYYRSFLNADTGQTCPIPQGIAMARSTDGGKTWTALDGGRPLPALRTVQSSGQHCTDEPAVASTWVYAPDVIVDGARLVMAFEQRDLAPNWFGPGQSRALHSVRYVTSTDGLAWSASTRLLAPGAVGAWDDEVGTPDLEKDGASFVVTFHAHDSTNRLKQRRAMVRMSALTEDFAGSRTQITLSQTPAWANYGVGMADSVKDSDGSWYIVFEAFSGATGTCGRTDTVTTVGLARTTNFKNWTVRQTPLLRGRDGLSCGYDMPAWMTTSTGLSIVTPNDPPENAGLARWNVITKAVVRSGAGGTSLTGGQYLDAGQQIASAGAYLVMQTDGNLVLYRAAGGVVWASDTNGTAATRALLQDDGNLVLLTANGTPVGATATDAHPGTRLLISTNSASLDQYGTAIWTRPTGSRGM